MGKKQRRGKTQSGTVNRVEAYESVPIPDHFPKPSQKLIDQLTANHSAVIVPSEPRIIVDNTYCKMGIDGSDPTTYLRKSLLDKIKEALALIQPDYGFLIFDGYRSRQTQSGLFHNFLRQIRKTYPTWSESQIQAETRKFVAHPDEPSRFEIPPHNSGGAIDITLTFRGMPVSMGTEFDDLTEKAATKFFETPFRSDLGFSAAEWEQVRAHRRILFHALCSVGFINWRFEWWHYDLGNCIWAQEHEVPWIYDSMDSLVSKLKLEALK